MKTFFCRFLCLFSFFGGFMLISCSENDSSPLNRLPKDRAGTVIKRAIDFSGGWDAWTDVHSVEYKKTTIRYNSDGSVGRRFVQLHQYRLSPKAKMRIEWTENDTTTTLVNNGYYAWKLINGELAATKQDSNQARNSTFGSHYVFCMPFKLTDPGANLKHVGEEVISYGLRADKVRVTYDPGAGDAGGLHTWTYYFDAQSGELLANLLQYDSNKFSFTEYLDYKQIAGLSMPTRRYGYQSNARGEKVSQTSEIFYEEIRFNSPLSDELFSSAN